MKITIYQDTICPWCYVGKEFLNQALNSWDGEVEVEYRSYFLNPNIPDDGIKDSKQYLDDKYGEKQANEMNENLRRIGKEAGIEFDLKSTKKVPNSKKSHQLLKIFPNHKEKLLNKLYEAYFIESEDIGDIEVLIEIVNSLNLPVENVRRKLENDEYLKEVMDDYNRAMNIGVRGVPFFVFNDEMAIYGAHKPDVILQTMKRIKARENIQLELT